MEFNILDYFKEEEIWIKSENGRELIRWGRYGMYSPFGLTIEFKPKDFYFFELLRTDGHISKDKVSIKLVNTDYGLINRFILFLYCLGFKRIRIEENENDYRVFVFNKTFAEILIRIFNIQAGKKSLTTCLPNWMKELDSKFTIPMLKGAFDGDGSVQNSSCRTRRVRLNTGSRSYAKDIQYLLNRLNISSKFFPDPRNDKNLFYVQISRKKEILKFVSLIGFRQRKRAKVLEKLINDYKWYTTEEAHNMILDIVKQNPGITGGKIAKLLNRAHSTVSAHLINLESKKLIKKVPHKQMKLIYLT